MGPGLAVQGFPEEIRRKTVFFLPRGPIQIKEDAAFIDIIKSMGFRSEGPDGAILQDEGINERVHAVEILPVSRNLIQGKQRGHHAAIHIVPGGRSILTKLFHVPDRAEW